MGYRPVHSPEELYAFYGHPQKAIDVQNARLSEIQQKHQAEEDAKKDEQERLAFLAKAQRWPDLYFVKGAAPLTLRSGTPPPRTDWFNDINITKMLPRGTVMLALRDQGQEVDVKVTISVDAHGTRGCI